MFMRRILLVLFLFIFCLSLWAQKETGRLAGTLTREITQDASDIKISIYPVPVRKGNFTIKCNKDISSVKITNIIGQDIFRAQYKSPQPVMEVYLPGNQKRGMYLVTVIFSNGARVVKKIMIEENA
jgi:hypothetical protein